MCGEREGVRVNRTEVTLCVEASNAFPNNSPFNYFNVCINNTDQIARKVWISSEKRNSRFKHNFLILIRNIICGDVWKFGTR
jgi:hypothetical protein